MLRNRLIAEQRRMARMKARQQQEQLKSTNDENITDNEFVDKCGESDKMDFPENQNNDAASFNMCITNSQKNLSSALNQHSVSEVAQMKDSDNQISNY